MPVDGPNISRAWAGARYAADIEHPEPWDNTQAVEPSILAICSVTRENTEGRNSAPPSERGCSMRKNPCSISVSRTCGGSSPRRSISSAAACSIGAKSRARAM